jgi:uncharacterized damage-inducible protein DinB
MRTAVDEAWLEALRYNKWANLRLLGVCGQLKKSQLELTAPGTYGTIAATWLHLVGAERRYLWRLGGNIGRFSQHRKFPGIATLKKQAEQSGDALIDIAKRTRAGEAVEGKDHSGFRFKVDKAILLVQAIHHGNDHRTHICTVLGHHGIPYADMDVWTYGEATGKFVEISPKA